MHNFIPKFKDINIIESTNSHIKAHYYTPNYYFEFIFSNDIYEWFVTMYDNNTKEEIWNDWSEWYMSGDVTKDNIDNFYKEDIRHFISNIQSSTEFKIIKKPKMIQGKTNDVWKTIEVGEIKN